MSCSKTQQLVLASIEFPLSVLIQQATKKKKKKKNNRYLFYYQENRIWHFMQWRQFVRNANLVLIVFTFDSRAVQSGINSVTVTSHSDQILRWSYSMHLLRTPGYSRSLLYIVDRCTDWSESLLVARTLYYSTFCRPFHQAFHMGL